MRQAPQAKSMWSAWGFLVLVLGLAIGVLAAQTSLSLKIVAVAVALLLATVGAVAIHQGSPSNSANRGAATIIPSIPDVLRTLPPLWTVTMASFIIFAVDYQAKFTLRYEFVLVPFCILLFQRRRRTGRPVIRLPDIFLGALLLWGLSGSTYSKVFFHTKTSYVAIFLPMAAGLLTFLPSGRINEGSALLMLEALAVIGVAYPCIFLAANLSNLVGVYWGTYTKEKSFLFPIGAMATHAVRRFTWTVAAVIVIFAIVVVHPAATYVSTAGVVLLTLGVTSTRGSRLFRRACGLALLFGFIGALWMTYNAIEEPSIVTHYFRAVGKSDNSSFRVYLLHKGVAQLRSHLLFGNSFTGTTSFRTPYPGLAKFAPPHNDYLQLAMGGGILGIFLFVSFAVAVNTMAIRRYRRLLVASMTNQAALLRVFLTSFNAFLAVCLFNPILATGGLCVMFFLIYGSMRLLCNGPVVPDAVPAESEQASTAVAGSNGRIAFSSA